MSTTTPPSARPVGRPAAVAVLLLALPLVAGCALGFRNLHPDEDSAVYAPLFTDLIFRFDSPEWLWTRGVIAGDFDSDNRVDEEAVVATIQTGDERAPDPIIEAYLAICKVNPDGSRTAIARTRLFGENPVNGAQKVGNNAYRADATDLRHAKAQIVPGKLRLGDSVVVYFWGDEEPSTVWFATYRLEDGMLTRNLDIALRQELPGVMHASLDKRVGPDASGYQLVFPSAALPASVAEKMGDGFQNPLWGHVFTPDGDGRYRQADERFGEHYARLENSWNQAYVKAVMQGRLDKSDLAWFEYHLGLLNHFTGNDVLAMEFLEKAAAASSDGNLSAAIAKAKALVPAPRQ